MLRRGLIGQLGTRQSGGCGENEGKRRARSRSYSPFGTAGDKHDLVGHIEEVSDVHGVSDYNIWAIVLDCSDEWTTMMKQPRHSYSARGVVIDV